MLHGNTLLITNCTSGEIQSLIEILKANKASEPNGISKKMLKGISVPLNIFVDCSFKEGKFVVIWKQSNVISLPKGEIILNSLIFGQHLFYPAL